MILCVDPGLCEWAFASFDEGGNLLHSKTFKYKSKDRQEVRLSNIRLELHEYLNKFGCGSDDVIVVERQFVDIMAQIVGVIRSVGGYFDNEVVLFAPKSWKKLATGKGNIPEDELKKLVVERYPELTDKSEHELDCAGIYLAYRKKVGLE